MVAGENITEQDLKENIEKQLHEGGRVMATIAQKYFEAGEEKGIEKGMIIGLLDGIELDLVYKFGDKGLREFSQIRNINEIKILRQIQTELKKVKSLDELRKFYK
jgi:hypothetical protein